MPYSESAGQKSDAETGGEAGDTASGAGCYGESEKYAASVQDVVEKAKSVLG